MSTSFDELRMIAMNVEPLTLPQAMGMIGMRAKVIVYVVSTVELAEACFRTVRHFLQEGIEKISNRNIELKDGTKIRFLTDSEVERGALRGYSNVLWVA